MSKRSINQQDATKTQPFGREQYTPLTSPYIIETPLFSVTGSPIDNRVGIGRRRRRLMEQRLQNTRELQRVLITEDLPEIPGYSLTGAYRPASEVGGDFFQVIPLQDNAALVGAPTIGSNCSHKQIYEENS